MDITLKYVYDHPPPATIVLVSQDKDFAHALGSLRLRQYRVVVIGRDKPSPLLAAQADEVYTLSSPPKKPCAPKATEGKEAKAIQNPQPSKKEKGG